VEHDTRFNARRRFLIVVSMVVLVLLALAIGIAALKPHAVSAAIAKLVSASKPSPTPPKHPDAGVYSTPQKSLDLKATGSEETKQFTVGSDWDLVWSYDCSNTKVPGPGNFMVSVFDSKGRVSADTPPIMQFGTKGSGVQHYHKAGDYFLGVRSSCTWHTQTQPGSSSNPSASPSPKATQSPTS
jgi:hypothetical protein